MSTNKSLNLINNLEIKLQDEGWNIELIKTTFLNNNILSEATEQEQKDYKSFLEILDFCNDNSLEYVDFLKKINEFFINNTDVSSTQYVLVLDKRVLEKIKALIDPSTSNTNNIKNNTCENSNQSVQNDFSLIEKANKIIKSENIYNKNYLIASDIAKLKKLLNQDQSLTKKYDELLNTIKRKVKNDCKKCNQYECILLNIIFSETITWPQLKIKLKKFPNFKCTNNQLKLKEINNMIDTIYQNIPKSSLCVNNTQISKINSIKYYFGKPNQKYNIDEHLTQLKEEVEKVYIIQNIDDLFKTIFKDIENYPSSEDLLKKVKITFYYFILNKSLYDFINNFPLQATNDFLNDYFFRYLEVYFINQNVPKILPTTNKWHNLRLLFTEHLNDKKLPRLVITFKENNINQDEIDQIITYVNDKFNNIEITVTNPKENQ